VLDSGLSYTGISIFTNAADTRTRGVELTATYASDFGELGHIEWSAGVNYNETAITKQYPLPAVVTNAAYGQTSILGPTAISALTTATPREKVILGAYWTLSKWSVNLRETVYGPTSEIVSTSGTGVGGITERIGTTGITDLDVGYKLTSAIKLEIGANNLFDTKPPSRPNIPVTGGGVRPADGSNVYDAPIGFSPFGIDGGYYYGRVTFTF
jgi:iron complex outermembrane receptor protein